MATTAFLIICSKIMEIRKLDQGKPHTELFWENFPMTLQLMRFQSQNLFKVKSLYGKKNEMVKAKSLIREDFVSLRLDLGIA